MTRDEIMVALKEFGNDQTKKIFLNHGAIEPFFGVKVGDLKTIQKKVKKNHDLSLELYETGNSDAMYLAGLIADEKQISKEELQHWVENAYWYMLSEYTVAWITAESRFGMELAVQWIESENENICSAGWATLSNLLALTPNESIDINQTQAFMSRILNTIHTAPNRVRYTMNGFIISVGSYISELAEEAKEYGRKIGKVSVQMGNTSCKVPESVSYIEKVQKRSGIAKKKKKVRC